MKNKEYTFQRIDKILDNFFTNLIKNTIFQTETDLYNKIYLLKTDFKKELFDEIENTFTEISTNNSLVTKQSKIKEN